MSLSLRTATSPRLAETDEFRRLTESLAQIASHYDVEVIPYDNPQLPHFQALTDVERLQLLAHFRPYVEVCEAAHREGRRFGDSSFLVYKMLKRLGLEAKSDFTDRITPNSIVEIYSRQHVQIFRNLGFLKCVSYTLEDLCCRTWFELFRRDEGVTREMFLSASRVFDGEIAETFQPNVPRHELTEITSRRRNYMHVHLDWMSPVYRGSEVVGGIVLERVELVEKSR